MSTAAAPKPRRHEPLFQVDLAHRILVGVHAETPMGVAEFSKFQSLCLGHDTEISPAARALGLLIAQAAVVQKEDLGPAYLALAGAFECDGQILIEWHNARHDKQDRRELRSFLRLWVPRVPLWPSIEESLADLLRAVRISKIFGIGPDDVLLDGLLAAARAFARVSLPPGLFAHVVNHAKFTLLPKTCLTRLSSKQPLASSPAEPRQRPQTDRAYAKALDAALLGRAPLGSASDAGFATRLITALNPRPSGGAVSPDRWSNELCGLALAAIHRGAAACLLYCFSIELLDESGWAPGTPYDYVRSLAADFLALFGGVDFARLSQKKYEELYTRLMGSEPDPRRSTALRQLHRFLREWDLVPALPHKARTGVIAPRVRANVIWRHEVDLALDWVAGCERTRVIDMVECALALASDGNFRTGELCWLRLEGIRVHESCIEIDVNPRRSDPSPKSIESQRRVLIEDPRAVGIVSKFVIRRRLEEKRSSTLAEASEVDEHVQGYLFCHPSDPDHPYKPAALARTLNLLLKAATGDPTVSIHTFRHTQGSSRTQSAYLTPTSADINPIDIAGSAMGHASGGTLLHSYAHRVERPISTCAEAEMAARLELDSTDVEFWTGIMATTVRKKASRAGLSDSEQQAMYLNLIAQTALAAEYKLVHEGVPPGDRRKPLILNDSEITLTRLVNAFSDICGGFKVAQVALRQDMSEQELRKWLSCLAQLSDRLTGRRIPSPTPDVFAIEALRDAEGLAFGIRPQFHRLAQSHWARVWAWLDANMADPCVQRALRYWLSVASRDYLPLVASDGLSELLTVLKRSGINLSLLHVCVNHSNGVAAGAGSVDGGLPPELDTELATVLACCHETLGQTPSVLRFRRRAGRPALYLAIGNVIKNGREERQGAGRSIAGLHCLFAAAYVTSKKPD
jgi:hypothetical protein